MLKKHKRNVALHNAIFESGIEQRAIAKRAKVASEKLSHAVYGRRTLDPDEQKRIAQVLGVPVDELFSVAS